MHEERLKYALVNKFGRTLCTVEGRDGLEDVIERYNARKYSRYHVHHVVQIIEQDMPVAQITKKYFMGVDAWVCEVQKSLHVKSYFEGERYTPIVVSGIGDVDVKHMAEMIIQRLEIEEGEVMGENFLYLEEYNCIIRTGDTSYEKLRKKDFEEVMAMPDGKERDEAFNRCYLYGESHASAARADVDRKMEELVLNGYVSTGRISYDGRLMDRIKREYPDLAYEFTKDGNGYGVRIVDQDRRN